MGRRVGDVAAADALKQVSHGHKLYFHRVGTAQGDDAVVFERPDDLEMLVGGGVTEDGRYLVLSSGERAYECFGGEGSGTAGGGVDRAGAGG